jgi:hypothetical protein
MKAVAMNELRHCAMFRADGDLGLSIRLMIAQIRPHQDVVAECDRATSRHPVIRPA